MIVEKYSTDGQDAIADGIDFKFDQWHAIGISFGSDGQYIMLDGKLVASEPTHTQKLGRGGNHSAPVDIPTIGESVSAFWNNNQHEGGFEGVVDKFRVSDIQKDWVISKNDTDSDCFDLKKGLVAYYPFNGNANDESGNKNNGTSNGASLTTDRFGTLNSAYSFDGVDDYIDFSNVPLNDSNFNSEEATISSWVYIDQNTTGFTLMFNDISDTDYALISINDNQISLLNRNGSFGTSYKTSFISEKGWNFITSVYKNGSAKLYVDGKYIDSNTGFNVIGIDKFLIGCDQNIGGSNASSSVRENFFNSSIDDIRIYNRALSEAEIKALYHEGVDEDSIQYKIGINVGIQKCFEDPSSCGITETSAQGCTQEQLDSAIYEATSTLIKPDGTSVLDGTKMLFTLEEITNKVQEALENGDYYTQEQVEEKIGKVLAWGDFNGDGKIGLEEAIKALMVIADNKEE